MWRDEALLLDMLLAGRKVVEFTKGVSWHRFKTDEVLQNAVMRQVQIIGEAARKISFEFQAARQQIPWAAIIGVRHHLVHEHFRIIPEQVRAAVTRDVPAHIPTPEPLVPPADPRAPA